MLIRKVSVFLNATFHTQDRYATSKKMKYKYLILSQFIFFNFFSFSQEIKEYKAEQKKDSDFFEYEDYEAPDKPIGKLIFLKGCSWYCGGGVSSLSSSSELEENNGITYSAKNAHDFDKNTAWIEGKDDYGIGEFIEYTFDYQKTEKYSGNLGINRFLIANGYKKSLKTWKNNSRVKQLKVYLNDKLHSIINLLDSFEIQTIEIGETIMFQKNTITKLKFEITEVYEGDKYADTAISLLMFDGIGVH